MPLIIWLENKKAILTKMKKIDKSWQWFESINCQFSAMCRITKPEIREDVDPKNPEGQTADVSYILPSAWWL